jgi:hypothetical protein
LGIVFVGIPAEFCCTALADTLTLPITMALADDWPPPKEEPLPARADGPAQYVAGPIAGPRSQATEGTDCASAVGP